MTTNPTAATPGTEEGWDKLLQAIETSLRAVERSTRAVGSARFQTRVRTFIQYLFTIGDAFRGVYLWPGSTATITSLTDDPIVVISITDAVGQSMRSIAAHRDAYMRDEVEGSTLVLRAFTLAVNAADAQSAPFTSAVEQRCALIDQAEAALRARIDLARGVVTDTANAQMKPEPAPTT